MFHGFDFDGTMLRIGSINLMLHGIEDPKIEARDSLSEDYADINEAFTMILANPPFKGSVEKSTIAKDLTKVVSTTKTELLFLLLFLRILIALLKRWSINLLNQETSFKRSTRQKARRASMDKGYLLKVLAASIPLQSNLSDT